MNINQKFAIWCVRRCKYLWKPSNDVFTWLDDPENSTKAKAAVNAARDSISIVNWATKSEWAARITWNVAASISFDWETPIEETGAIKWAAKALDMTIVELKQEFMSTLNDEELSTTDPFWIEHATIEIFAR